MAKYMMRLPVSGYLILHIGLLLFSMALLAQEDALTGPEFVIERQVGISPVKDQGPSGTCWSFATVSLIESELMRMGKGSFDLSEMYMVRVSYLAKADKYVRMHGTISFGSGGEANDVTDAIASAGIMPESVYPGVDFDVNDFNFEMMDRRLKEYVDNLIDASGDKLDPDWKKEFEEILDRFLGAVPDTFEWNNTLYTPLSFASSLDINTDDYILIGSYTHHPFYEKFILEIPDNWSWENVYNVPLEEMIEIIDQSLLKGYSVVWATDITEEGFSFAKGLAVNGENTEALHADEQQADHKGMLKTEAEADLNEPSLMSVSQHITQEMRQEAFDHFETQDDHAMHIVGTARDKKGDRFYYVKNSWGRDNAFKGFMFASEPYVKFKTVSFMINRHALESDQLKKLSITDTN